MRGTAAYYASVKGAAGDRDRRGCGFRCADGSRATPGISRGLDVAAANHHTLGGETASACNG